MPSSGAVLAYDAVDELTDDVEVSDVPGVLLDEVEQDPFECRGSPTFPSRARLTDITQLVGAHD